MDKFTYAVVGGVLAMVAVGLATAIFLRGHEAPPDLSTPSGVTLAYAQAELRGDGETAWDLLAPTVQARVDHDQFLARFTAQANAKEYLTVEDERLDVDGAGGASVVLVRTLPESSGLFGSAAFSARKTVRLARDGSAWRITVPPDDYLPTKRA